MSLLESSDHQCPNCKKTDVSPDTLEVNLTLRTSVFKFQNGVYDKINKSFPKSDSESPELPCTSKVARQSQNEQNLSSPSEMNCKSEAVIEEQKSIEGSSQSTVTNESNAEER